MLSDVTNSQKNEPRVVVKYFNRGADTDSKKPSTGKYVPTKYDDLTHMTDAELQAALANEYCGFNEAYDRLNETHELQFPLATLKLLVREEFRRRQWPYGK